MAEVTCPLCKRADQIEVLMSKLEGQVHIGAWSCGHCRHAWRTELWKESGDIEHFTRATYTNIEYVRRYDAAKLAIFKRGLRWANEVTPQQPRLMLDFGCSCGTVMQMFKEHGWNIMGIEISPTAQKMLDERNLPWARCLEESGLALGSVDVVMMNDTIYYLPDPIETWVQIRSYTKPGGRIFLRHPTRWGLLHLLLKVRRKSALGQHLWGDHIHLFSRRSTKLTLKRAGFIDVRFYREKGFRRTLKNKIFHYLLRTMDWATFGFYDFTLSWTVIAKTP